MHKLTSYHATITDPRTTVPLKLLGEAAPGRVAVEVPGSPYPELWPVDQFEKYADRFFAMAAQAEKRAAAPPPAKPAVFDTDGFAETFPPARAAKVRAALEKQVVSKGELIRRRDLIRREAAAGWTVVVRGGERRWTHSNGDTFRPEGGTGGMTKTEVDYAAFITRAKTNPRRSARRNLATLMNHNRRRRRVHKR